MNIISIFFASLVMASTLAIGTVDNGDAGTTPTTTKTIPPPAPPTQPVVVAPEE
jgi:hypothetical protein